VLALSGFYAKIASKPFLANILPYNIKNNLGDRISTSN
jgi:hypothetical protein